MPLSDWRGSAAGGCSRMQLDRGGYCPSEQTELNPGLHDGTLMLARYGSNEFR